MKFVTHSGNAHCDDLFSYTILSEIYPEHTLVRTRDKSITCGGENTIVFDVGMKFDVDEDLYDHHQADKELRENGVPYSSVGLVWKYFGQEYLHRIGISYFNIAEVHRIVDETFIFYIDLADNGIDDHPDSHATGHHASFSNVVEYLLNSGSDEDFIYASKFSTKILKGVCQSADKIVSDKEMVLSLVSSLEYLVMPKRGMKYLETLLDNEVADHIKFVIYPLGVGYGCSAVRNSIHGFSNRASFPKMFGGLVDQDLQEATKINDLTFSHTGGFFAAGNTIESLVKYINLALEQHYGQLYPTTA